MNEREQRGLIIAATCRLTKQESGEWSVPSQSGKGRYIVTPDAATPRCTCPDYETRGCKCKHIFAVEYAIRRETDANGDTVVTQTVTVTETVKRQTYPQVWEAYNQAQTHEKDHFLQLLHDLCRGIQDNTPKNEKGGRPRIPAADAVFAVCFKVYSTFSGRRFMSDLRRAQELGYIDRTPHFNSIFNALDNAELTPVLHAMIRETSLPLKTVEQDFAGDSSGFCTSRFVRWFDVKYNAFRQQHEWVKCHLMCGVKTNIVTAVVILDKDAADTKQMPALVEETKKNFTMREVSGDKAYGSLENYAAIADAGATPFIAFKSNATGESGGPDGLWSRMFHYFCFRREEFLNHYHKRSNVESTFGMIKAKFRDHVRAKTDTAMKNEVLAKIVCHNICCLIQEMYELGIEPAFWQPKTVLHKN